jgi:hypothetical protein
MRKPSSPRCNHLVQLVSAWLQEINARYLNATGSAITAPRTDYGAGRAGAQLTVQ